MHNNAEVRVIVQRAMASVGRASACVEVRSDSDGDVIVAVFHDGLSSPSPWMFWLSRDFTDKGVQGIAEHVRNHSAEIDGDSVGYSPWASATCVDSEARRVASEYPTLREAEIKTYVDQRRGQAMLVINGDEYMIERSAFAWVAEDVQKAVTRAAWMEQVRQKRRGENQCPVCPVNGVCQQCAAKAAGERDPWGGEQ